MQPVKAMELEDIFLLLEEPENANVAIPAGAVDLFPRKIGPRILYLPDQDQILKTDPSVKMSEAEVMRYVALHTSIPVPDVRESYSENDCGYIFMSKARGEPLGEIWKDLDSEKKASVIGQLQRYTEQLRTLTGEFYGALWNQPCEDIFFSHLPFHRGKIHYGPYYSRQQFNDGLAATLENSVPAPSLDDFEKNLASRIQAVTDETKVFSHGDLHPLNILVDHAGDVPAILDWDSAGFSINGREYYEARMRSRNDEWETILDRIFPEKARAHFDLLKEYDQTLTRYTGV